MQKEDKALKALESKVARAYKKAVKDVEKEAKDYFATFNKKDKIMAEKLAKNEITLKQYKEWRKGQMLAGKKYTELVSKLATDYSNAHKIATGIIDDSLPSVYAHNFNRATYEVEKGLKINTNFTLYDESTVERLLRENPDLLPKPRVDIPKELRWNKKRIHSILLQEIVKGTSVDTLASGLRKVTDMNVASSIRNARTMYIGAQNGGRVDSYKRAEDMGINLKKMWVATLDTRTRHSHARLDGESVGIDEEFSNGCKFPADPDGAPSEVYNCRCTIIADLKKAPRDLRNGRVSEMSYDDWQKMHKIKR